MIEIVLLYIILGVIYTTMVTSRSNILKTYGMKAAIGIWFRTFGIWPVAFKSYIQQWRNKN